MPSYRVSATIRISPRGLFRFGIHPANPGHLLALPASDTLAGALLSSAALLGDDLEGLVRAAARNEPPFLLSSAMPDVEGREPFVPRPQRLRSAPTSKDFSDERGTSAKQLKQVAYVERSVLPWYRGADVEFAGWGPLLLAGSTAIPGSPWATFTIPGVTVDRVSGASALYHQAMVAYCSGRPAHAGRNHRNGAASPRVGWAVHVLAEDEATLVQLQRWFQVLTMTGMGGRRSRGAGSIDFKVVQPALLPLTAEPKGLSLSWISPTQDELDAGLFSEDEDLGYRLDERHGWVASPWRASERSRRVLMVAEGSYLSPQLPAPVGRLVDVSPGAGDDPHPVYRWGFGLFLDEST